MDLFTLHLDSLFSDVETNKMLEREEWVESQKDEWEEIGARCKIMRTLSDVSVKEISTLLGISETRIRKFEKGEPVREAVLIESAYMLAVHYIVAERGRRVSKRNTKETWL